MSRQADGTSCHGLQRVQRSARRQIPRADLRDYSKNLWVFPDKRRQQAPPRGSAINREDRMIMRKLIGLSALLTILGVLAISASGASASRSECSAHFLENPVCVWSGSETGGSFAWWPASSQGCHSHAGIHDLRAFWNTSPYKVRLGGATVLFPGYGLDAPVNEPVTGEICWPV